MSTVASDPTYHSEGMRHESAYFLFTDLTSSTSLWELAPERMAGCMERHSKEGRKILELCGGHVFQEPGDGFCCAFADGLSAIRAARQYIDYVANRDWYPLVEPLKGRAALTRDNSPLRTAANSYIGNALNLAARLTEAANPGQIVASYDVSHATEHLLHETEHWTFLGHYRFRGRREPEAVYQLSASGETQDFPPLRAFEQRAESIPQRLDSFIGREKEVGELVKLTCDRRLRIVSLVGPGGVGKTRLSEVVADTIAYEFDYNVFRVSLASIDQIDQLPHVILTALGIDSSNMLTVEHLIRRMADICGARRLLLLADNCEHLISQNVANVLTGLVESLPGLNILATSWTPLHISGEHVYRVQPLSTHWLPNYPAFPAAMKLFLDRAASINSHYAKKIDNMELEIIAQLCERVGGLPLALELVAAWADILSPFEMLDRLNKHSELPERDGRYDHKDKKRSLSAAVNCSIDLLQPEERSMLKTVSVFSGPFTLESVEGVRQKHSERSASMEILPFGSSDILTEIARLADRSLLLVLPGEHIDRAVLERRIVMLPPVREIVMYQHTDAEHRLLLKLAHAGYYSEMARSMNQLFFTENDLKAYSWFVNANGDLTAAFDRMCKIHDYEMMTQIAFECCRPYYHMGWQVKAAKWLDVLILEARSADNKGELLQLLLRKIMSMLHDVDQRELDDMLSEAVALCDAVGTKVERTRIATLSSIVAQCRCDYKLSMANALRAIEGGRQVYEKSGQCALLLNAALNCSFAGDSGRAWKLLDDARLMNREIKSTHLSHFCEYIQAMLLLHTGDVALAKPHAHKAVKGFWQGYAYGDLGWALHAYGEACLLQGDYRGTALAISAARQIVRAWPVDM